MCNAQAQGLETPLLVDQTSANNTTPPRYSKNIQYSAIIPGQIVG